MKGLSEPEDKREAFVDNRQYREIVDAYADMVYRIALNQTRSGADADDVVQAVFLKLYEKPPEWLAAEGHPRDSTTGTHEQGGTTYVYQVSGKAGHWHANVKAQ